VKIGVCIKQVPPSDSRITIANAAEVDASVYSKLGINPYDEFALEEAVRLKDQGMADSVIVFTFDSRKDADKQIRMALAKGADEAVKISDDAVAKADCLGIARALAAAVQKEGVEMVFCGKQAIDGDNAQVPGMLAELLGWAQATSISKLELDGRDFKAWREIGGGSKGIISGSVPVVFSCDKGLNEPRFVKLKERMAAKKKPLRTVGLADLGLDASQIGTATIEETNWGLPPQRASCKFIEGEPKAAVGELIQLLREEAKVL
jgi:electron transfer flavoprotein beta subunit